MGSLEIHEARFKRSTGSSVEQAFQSRVDEKKEGGSGGAYNKHSGRGYSNRGRGRGRPNGQNRYQGKGNFQLACSHCGKTNHSEENCWHKNKGDYEKDDIQCYRCKKYGHIARDCEEKEQANFHEEKSSSESLFVAYLAANVDISSETWYLDSGCSNHMTGNRDYFVEIDDTMNSVVTLGDDKEVQVRGLGTITVTCKTGRKLIHDVMYVPDIAHNLMSLGQLMRTGYRLEFDNGECLIYNKRTMNLEFVVKMSKNKMFPIVFVQSDLKALKASNNDSVLWHRRFAHMGYDRLRLLDKENLVTGLPTVQFIDNDCEPCILGKHHREKFPVEKAWRATKSLLLVHSDICGPMQTLSLTESKYFLIFVDDFSRLIWVFFLKEKSEAFDYFKQFKATTEKESGNSIIRFRTDRGGEFTSREFELFCSDSGIQRQLTASYTPQQNGVAERKNRTIMEAVRSMLKDKNLPTNFWAEAVATAVYVMNRSPTQAVEGKTPYEAWFGRRPNVSNFRIFRSIAFAHVSAELRRKLDEKSVKYIFIGYSEQTKGYRLLNPITNKLVVSRDVIFKEDDAWSWDEKGMVLDAREISDFDLDFDVAITPPSPTSFIVDSTSDSPPRRVRSLADIYASNDFACLAIEPTCFEVATINEDWMRAMKEELEAIEKNKTWRLVELPDGKDAIGLKWIYKSKFNADCTLKKNKARLVVKGYAQIPRIDFSETFAPVARLDTVRIILSVAAHNGWSVAQLDVKSAFLNGDLIEDVYVNQPEGFVVKGSEHKVYKLHNALYGLKQAPRA